MKKCFLTIDVDMRTYEKDELVPADEFDLYFQFFKKFLFENGRVKSTWFIRIDLGIEREFGKKDYIFDKHKSKIEWLKSNGHNVGWHFHPYEVRAPFCREMLLSEMEASFEYVEKWGLDPIFRMGGCFGFNETMEFLENKKIKIDSSALPRPIYPWMSKELDWTITGKEPYHPSKIDYRISKEENYNMLEVPMTTSEISIETDDFPNILRYINPAYKSIIFSDVLGRLDGDIVVITHPYEILSHAKNKKELFSYDVTEFTKNMELLMSKYEMRSLDDFYK